MKSFVTDKCLLLLRVAFLLVLFHENCCQENVQKSSDLIADETQSPQFGYGYKIKGSKGFVQGHRVISHGSNSEGEYYVKLPDGSKQNVEYYTDESGYHPKVLYRTNGISEDSGYSSVRIEFAPLQASQQNATTLDDIEKSETADFHQGVTQTTTEEKLQNFQDPTTNVNIEDSTYYFDGTTILDAGVNSVTTTTTTTEPDTSSGPTISPTVSKLLPSNEGLLAAKEDDIQIQSNNVVPAYIDPVENVEQYETRIMILNNAEFDKIVNQAKTDEANKPEIKQINTSQLFPSNSEESTLSNFYNPKNNEISQTFLKELVSFIPELYGGKKRKLLKPIIVNEGFNKQSRSYIPNSIEPSSIEHSASEQVQIITENSNNNISKNLPVPPPQMIETGSVNLDIEDSEKMKPGMISNIPDLKIRETISEIESAIHNEKKIENESQMPDKNSENMISYDVSNVERQVLQSQPVYTTTVEIQQSVPWEISVLQENQPVDDNQITSLRNRFPLIHHPNQTPTIDPEAILQEVIPTPSSAAVMNHNIIPPGMARVLLPPPKIMKSTRPFYQNLFYRKQRQRPQIQLQPQSQNSQPLIQIPPMPSQQNNETTTELETSATAHVMHNTHFRQDPPQKMINQFPPQNYFPHESRRIFPVDLSRQGLPVLFIPNPTVMPPHRINIKQGPPPQIRIPQHRIPENPTPQFIQYPLPHIPFPFAITVPPTQLISLVQQVPTNPSGYINRQVINNNNPYQPLTTTQFVQKPNSLGSNEKFISSKDNNSKGGHTDAQKAPFRPSHPVWDSIYPPQHMYYVPVVVSDPEDRRPHSRSVKDVANRRNQHLRTLIVEYGGFKPLMIPSTLLSESDDENNDSKITQNDNKT